MGRHNYTTDVDELEKEVEFEFIKSSGPGGTHRDTGESAVRVFHPESGIRIKCADTRSQARNRKIALEKLADELKERNRPETKRKKTTPTQTSEEKRLKEKRIRAEKKKRRKKIDPSEYI